MDGRALVSGQVIGVCVSGRVVGVCVSGRVVGVGGDSRDAVGRAVEKVAYGGRVGHVAWPLYR